MKATKPKRARSLLVLALLALFSLATVALASTVCITPEAGGCHICYFYGADGSYQGYISWGGCAH